MRYFTKKWYELMGSADITSGITVIADKEYSDEEINAFYNSDLSAEIERDRKFHNSAVLDLFAGFESLICGTDDVFEHSKAGSEKRPYDPSETVAAFRNSYEGMLNLGNEHYPQWVRDVVDARLLALWRMPKAVFDKLKKYELKNKTEFERINKCAEEVFEAQNIPPIISRHFNYHDSNVLSFEISNENITMLLKKTVSADEDTPYEKIIFKNARFLECEGGLDTGLRRDDDGGLLSDFFYLYDELYREDEGFEIHMLFWIKGELAYYTIACGDIDFEEVEI